MNINDHARINLILGHGRSGTTWLGSIINSHPDIAYRFEPLHRLRKYNPHLSAMVRELREGDIDSNYFSRLYDELIVADPLTLKPPFFKKNYSRETGIEKIWICSRAVRPVKFIYSYLYTPKSNPSMVIKEVDFEQEMSTLLTRSSIPLVYLIRHPCGNILSHVKGQESKKMTPKRNQHLGKFMKKNAPDLYERHKGEIANMSVLEIVAWFWRISLDLGVKAIQESGRGKLLTYEQLCDDADGCAKSIFDYFGLSYPTVAQDFVAGLYASDASQNSGRKKDLMDGYFTVHRNPRKQKDAWKSKITSEQRKVIEGIVKDSPAFEYCAALGNWD